MNWLLLITQKKEYSIFEAYNLGVERSSYPYLCFIHEDILFRSRNWGKALSEAFQHDEKIGLIGVIGTNILPYLPLGWWSGPIIGSVIQSKKMEITNCDRFIDNKPNSILQNAVACDGLFLSIPRAIFDKVSFDTINFNGFHCYDIGICMQVIKIGHKVAITNNIKIEHFSLGNPDNKFVKASAVFNKKWGNILPCACDGITTKEITEYNEKWLETLLDNRRYVFFNAPILFSRSMNLFTKCFNATDNIRRIVRDWFHL